jgi:RND family efflux transporter MFP subunit
VSKQQVDSAIATAEADQATVESQKANLDHLQQEENFKTIIAPFDGTITQRNTDVGSLINGGGSGTTTGTGNTDSTTTGQDLFHIADTSKLRIYVQVPESYSNAVKPDLKVEMHVPQHPQQVFPATLTRTADALDPTTRTLLIELEVDNADAALLSGGYTDVDIKIPSVNETVTLPVNALLFRDKMSVALIKDNYVTLKRVTIGRDYGKTVEIIDGLSPGDMIVVNPPDSLESGQEVRIAQPDQSKGADKSKDQNKSSDPDTSKDKGMSKDKDKSKDSDTSQNQSKN